MEEKINDAIKAALIIEQQNEMLKEMIGEISATYGVKKSVIKKLIMASARSSLDKAHEKIDEERETLNNAETFINVLASIDVDSIDTELE